MYVPELNTEGVIETAVAVREHSHERQGQNSRREMYEIGGFVGMLLPRKGARQKAPNPQTLSSKIDIAIETPS